MLINKNCRNVVENVFSFYLASLWSFMRGNSLWGFSSRRHTKSWYNEVREKSGQDELVPNWIPEGVYFHHFESMVKYKVVVLIAIGR